MVCSNHKKFSSSVAHVRSTRNTIGCGYLAIIPWKFLMKSKQRLFRTTKSLSIRALLIKIVRVLEYF